MKPWRTWLARLGAFGALAIVFGCGSGDVPDPGSDSEQAALPEGSAPDLPSGRAAAAPAAEKVGAEEGDGAGAEDATAQAQPAAPAQAPAGGGAAASPDRNSATAEMLALSQKEPPAPPAGGDAAPGPGGAAGPGGGAANMGPGAGGPGPGGMGMGGMQAQMQQQQQQQAQMQGQMRGQMQGQMRGQMQPGGGGGPGMGGPGGPGGSNKPPDFRSPQGAVNAFLDALKARDLNRLTEATALRAGTNDDTVKRNQDLFRRIIDGTLSDQELTDLAKLLEGYKFGGFDVAKSTGRLKVILRKSGANRSSWSIVVTARREKKGWGVCDISRPSQLKNPSYGLPARRSKN